MPDTRKLCIFLTGLVAFAAIYAGCIAHGWDIDNARRYQYFDAYSEGTSIAGIARAHAEGSCFNALFPQGSYTASTYHMKTDKISFANRTYMNPSLVEEYGEYYKMYKSQPAIMTRIICLIDQALPLPPRERFSVLKHIAVSESALALAVIVAWLYASFGLAPALIATGAYSGSIWLTAPAQNLYWHSGISLLPLLVSACCLLRSPQRTLQEPFRRFVLPVSLTVFLRLSSGYEFISGIMLSPLCVMLYAGLLYRWTRAQYIRAFKMAVAAALIGFNAAIILHCLLLAISENGLYPGLLHLRDNVITRRAYYGPFAREGWQSILYSYLFDNGLFTAIPAFSFFHLFALATVTTTAALMLTPGSPLQADRRRRLAGLSAAMWLSLAGPLTWYILVKGHSAWHRHIDYIAWYVPSATLAYMVIAAGLCWLARNFYDDLTRTLRRTGRPAQNP